MNILEYCIRKIKESKDSMNWNDFENYSQMLDLWTKKLASEENE